MKRIPNTLFKVYNNLYTDQMLF